LLRPLAVMNPYAQYLTFPDQTTRLRRDHEKYLTLIDTLALLHQHQRPIKIMPGSGGSSGNGSTALEYIEVTLDDIRLANRIAHDVLGRSLDELPPQTRRLLKLIDGFVTAECARLSARRADFRFSRRALREAIAWGDTQLKIHLARLAELEYLVAHRGKAGGFDYELVYDAGDADALRFPGLADIEALRRAYDGARSGSDAGRSAPGREAVGLRSAGGRVGESPADAEPVRLPGDLPGADSKTYCSPPPRQSRSSPKGASSGAYPQAVPLAAASA
jgi:hypothetical protein